MWRSSHRKIYGSEELGLAEGRRERLGSWMEVVSAWLWLGAWVRCGCVVRVRGGQLSLQHGWLLQVSEGRTLHWEKRFLHFERLRRQSVLYWARL